MIKKAKSWLRTKYCKLCVIAATMVSVLCVAASAADESTAITGAFTTGFTKMASDAMGMIAIIVPIAVGVAGTIFLAKKAMGWFKSLAK